MSKDLNQPLNCSNSSKTINEQGDQYVECKECGAVAEIGTVIREGDVVFNGTISADSQKSCDEKFDKFLNLAKQITDLLEVKKEFINETTLKYTFTFSCTAEKMIYEMRLRSIK